MDDVNFCRNNGQHSTLPLRRNALTLTTTRTLPPGSILPIGVTLPSRERRDGVDAEDLMVRSSDATPGINLGSSAICIN
jgi:hypothetical protein